MPEDIGPAEWLLLIHHLPAHPAYERVKLRRRLQAIGAVAVKKTVQALPRTDDTLEDLLWTAKAIEAAGGEALVCEAELLHGVSDAELRQRFDAARDADYASLTRDIRAALPRKRARAAPSRRSARAAGRDAAAPATPATVARLRKRLAEIVALDFYGADGRAATEAALLELEAELSPVGQGNSRDAMPARQALKELCGKTWVTRRKVHVDRIACAWFVRRFIDPAAGFKFVDPGYLPARNELRFDMAEGEFTHRGDLCSFETMLSESGLRDTALRAIAEIVHDLDLKDGKFGRAEAEGVRQILAGITLATEDDPVRLDRGASLFDDLYRSLQRKPVSKNRRT